MSTGRPRSELQMQEYRICSIEKLGYFEDIVDLRVKLKQVDSERSLSVNCLRFGWLYRKIVGKNPLDDFDVSDIDKRNRGDKIVGVIRDGSVYAFGEKGSKRIKKIQYLLKSSEIQRKT